MDDIFCLFASETNAVEYLNIKMVSMKIEHLRTKRVRRFNSISRYPNEEKYLRYC